MPRPPRSCRVAGCDRRHRRRGYCEMHMTRWRRNNPDLKILSYTGVHVRMNRLLGRPAEHPCVDCGVPAKDWSYQHGDPAELMSPEGVAYSLHPEFYVARCRPCHKRFDLTAPRPAIPEPPRASY